MIRFVFRFFGLLCLALAFILLVYDGTQMIANRAWAATSVGKIWYAIDQSSLPLFQAAIERHVSVWLWQAVLQPYFLEQPAWLILAVLGLIFSWLGRKEKPVIGYARD
jgi:hypothetical protein